MRATSADCQGNRVFVARIVRTEIRAALMICFRVPLCPYLQTGCGNAVHHRTIPKHRQIEAVAVEGDELRLQLTDF
jgi:hypothetical protein